jgi:hypothetical protein
MSFETRDPRERFLNSIPISKSSNGERNLIPKSTESEYSIRMSPTTPTRYDARRITSTAVPPKTPRRQKASSISLYPPVDGVTVTIKVMMQCLSRAVWYEIRDNEFDFGTPVDVFCEDSHTFIPSMRTIENFFSCIFNTKSLSIECAVTAVAYVDKLKKISVIKLNRINWKRICFIAVLEADKVLRDKLVWNEDYKDIIPGIDLNLLRKLERAFLKYIEFSLTLSQSDYTIYLLELLSLRQKEPGGAMKIGRPRKGSHTVETKRLEEARLELNKSM